MVTGCGTITKEVKILIIEDDLETLRAMQLHLKKSGYGLFIAQNSQEGLSLVPAVEPDLVLLGVHLPVLDSWQFLYQVRLFSRVPIIIVSQDDRSGIKGLELGADDYITKAFNPSEFKARIEAILRRLHNDIPKVPNVFKLGKLTVDFTRNHLIIDSRVKKLTHMEGLLLRYFIKNPGCPLTNEEILTNVWGEGYRGDHQLLRMAVSRLRKKIGNYLFASELIRTHHGIGYIFEVQSLLPHNIINTNNHALAFG